MGSRILFPLTAIALICVFAALSLAETGTDSGGPTADGALTDDDGGTPLFAAGALRPGEQVTRCIKLNYSGTNEIPVTMYGKGSGGLDQYIDLQIQIGGGGAYGDCSGFAGTTLFQGTLAQFLHTGDSTSSELPAWNASEEASTRTFQVTVGLQDVPAAEGQTASASFEWKAPGQATPPPSQPDEPQPDSPAQPEPTPKAPPVAKIKPPAPVKEAPAPTPHHEASPVHPKAAPKPPPPGAKPAGKSFLDHVRDVAVGAGKRVAFPTFLSLLAFLFILVQNRLDDKDPKLAMAPKHRDDDLEFGPLPWAKAGTA